MNRVAAALEDARDALREIDEHAQRTAQRIGSLCRAAAALLQAGTPQARADIEQLLRAIDDTGQDHEGYVSGEAANRGAAFVRQEEAHHG